MFRSIFGLVPFISMATFRSWFGISRSTNGRLINSIIGMVTDNLSTATGWQGKSAPPENGMFFRKISEAQLQPSRQHILLQLIVAVENGTLAEAAPKKQVLDMDVVVVEGIKQSKYIRQHAWDFFFWIRFLVCTVPNLHQQQIGSMECQTGASILPDGMGCSGMVVAKKPC